MTDEKLSSEEVGDALEDMKIWSLGLDRLETRVEFNSYRDAVFFANTVFSLAEEEFHHPEVTVEYGAVEIDLWSHDAGGVTERDLEIARKIEDKVREIDWE